MTRIRLRRLHEHELAVATTGARTTQPKPLVRASWARTGGGGLCSRRAAHVDRTLRQSPQQVGGPQGQRGSAAIADHVHQFVEVLDLQPVVERVAETMGPTWNSDSVQRTKSTMRDQRDGPGRPTSCAWLGGDSHASGNATPNRNTRMGISSADSTPPALNSIHSKGSIESLRHAPHPRRSQPPTPTPSTQAR